MWRKSELKEAKTEACSGCSNSELQAIVNGLTEAGGGWALHSASLR